jgi:hypothetical protein
MESCDNLPDKLDFEIESDESTGGCMRIQPIYSKIKILELLIDNNADVNIFCKVYLYLHYMF